MVSLYRTVSNVYRVGFKAWYRAMWGIGDAKFGRLVGTDKFGNKYYENTNPREEVPGRHRWIDFSQHDFNASQVPPEWHSWLVHIRKDVPTEDPIMIASTPPWKAEYVENLTGTRGHWMTYSTVLPKIRPWDPKVKARGGAASAGGVKA